MITGDWKIIAEGNETWYSAIDQFGKFELNLPAGNYTLQLFSGNTNASWPVHNCQSDLKFDIESPEYDTTFINIPVVSNAIEGHVFTDFDQNCIPDGDLTDLSNWIVEAIGSRIYYGNTDEEGKYFIPVDTGTYFVKIKAPNSNWMQQQHCNMSNYNISLSGRYYLSHVELPITRFVYCPRLSVDIGTDFLRIGSESTYSVYYCNEGTSTAEDAFVDIAFDPFMTVTNTSIPGENTEGNIYRFELGTVEVNDCGNFSVDVMLNEDSVEDGQNHCVAANIQPNDECSPADTTWDGSDVRISSECEDDTIIFKLQNIGEPMEGPAQYHVYEDILMLNPDNINSFLYNLPLWSGEYLLDSYEEITYRQPFEPISETSSYVLVLEQRPGYPFAPIQSLRVSDCDEGEQGLLSREEEGETRIFYEAISCQQNVVAMISNDKLVNPSGIGAEGYITETDDLEYKIRFQNITADTSFQLVIRDTISHLLDIASVRSGAASHPYQFEVFGYENEGRYSGILQWTFKDANLPPSFVNEQRSKGFVKFFIKQKNENPIDELIENKATIQLSHVEAIVTNAVSNTIGEPIKFLQYPEFPGAESHVDDRTNPADQYPQDEGSYDNKLHQEYDGFVQFATATGKNLLAIYPNPFKSYTTVEINFVEEEMAFAVYDINGRLVYSQSQIKSKFVLHRDALSSGVYFFRLLSENGMQEQGKLFVE